MSNETNWLRIWWMDLVNRVDEALIMWVFKRRGPAFIFYFTDPAAWNEFMAAPVDDEPDYTDLPL